MMSSRTWVKINCDRWFDGTIRREPIEVRAIWTDLLALAGRTGCDGVIRLPGTSNVGFTDPQIASIFNVTEHQWLEAKARLQHHPDGEGENRIRVNGGNCIEIINWSAYQSEYIRQKSYREKLQQKVTTKSYSRKCGEKEREKERSKDLKSKINNPHKRTVYPTDFEKFWAVYPRRVEKLDALSAWIATTKEYPADDLISAAQEYAAECIRQNREVQHIKHPATFLRRERWKDYCFTDSEKIT